MMAEIISRHYEDSAAYSHSRNYLMSLRRWSIEVLCLAFFAALSAAAVASDETHSLVAPPVPQPESAQVDFHQHSPAPSSLSCNVCESHAMSFGFAIGPMLTPLHGGASCVATIGIPLHSRCNDCTAFIGTPLHPHAFASHSQQVNGTPGCSACQQPSLAAAPCVPTRVVEQYRNGQLTLVVLPAE